MAILNPYNYAKPKNFIKSEPSAVVRSIPDKSNTSQSDQYLENKIMAAKPEELTYMLYDGLVKFIKKAMISLENGSPEGVNQNAQRAQAIIDELRSTLNMEVEMSESMDSLYEYLGHKLLIANIDKSEKEFKDALEIAEDFKETWKQAFDIKY